MSREMNTASPATTAPAPAAHRTSPVLWVVRAAGLFQFVTGLLFWSGNALSLVPLHMLAGLTVVIALWVIAASATRAGVSLAPVIGAVAWGVLVLALGLTQSGLLQGDLHWIVQLAHLLVGLAAVALAHVLARASQSARGERGPSRAGGARDSLTGAGA